MDFKNKYLYRNESSVSSKIENESYILNLKTNEYLKLNQTASFIWGLLESKNIYSSIVEECKSRFKGFDESGLQQFLDAAISKGIIVIDEN